MNWERETPSSSSLSLYTSITHNIILHTLNPLQEFVYQEETTESVRKVTSHPVSWSSSRGRYTVHFPCPFEKTWSKRISSRFIWFKDPHLVPHPLPSSSRIVGAQSTWFHSWSYLSRRHHPIDSVKMRYVLRSVWLSCCCFDSHGLSLVSMCLCVSFYDSFSLLSSFIICCCGSCSCFIGHPCLATEQLFITLMTAKWSLITHKL